MRNLPEENWSVLLGSIEKKFDYRLLTIRTL